MTDFLLELRSEEIPARMQGKARDDLARLFTAELAKAGLTAAAITTYATPRRLALIARDLPDATQAVSDEVKGPKTSAPPQALDGFLRKTGLTREQLTERDGVFFAVTEKPGRATAAVLAEAIPAIIRAFPWPKSMRWGAASASTESLRWVRPLHGIVAIFGEELVPVEVAGISSGYATLGHRFHHPGPITLGGAHDYVEKLRACHVLVDSDERAALIRDRAAAAAREAGLELVADEGLVAENAGLTEWPVSLLGRFDPAFLDVPPEVIQLTARVNQKYFVCRSPLPLAGGAGGGEGALANAFLCTANIDATDAGAAIVEGNRKVLAARLADARFFYEGDLKVPLEEQARKLDRIVFHEKLGTVADKVERVAKLARWLVEEGVIPLPAGERDSSRSEQGEGTTEMTAPHPGAARRSLSPAGRGELADLADRAARLAKADLVTGMVGEFPELQGVMGGYYARAQGEDARVADAIRDHYKPVGQGDEVPTDPVTVAVSLADKLDTISAFFAINEKPTGSKDPFALRRAALGVISIVLNANIALPLHKVASRAVWQRPMNTTVTPEQLAAIRLLTADKSEVIDLDGMTAQLASVYASSLEDVVDVGRQNVVPRLRAAVEAIPLFFADRLKVQQREAGVRHDLIDAVFALGGEDDLVRLLARVRALQQFIGSEDGANLLTGYRRAANILKKEGYNLPSPLQGRGGSRAAAEGEGPSGAAPASASPDLTSGSATLSPEGERERTLSYTPEPAESALMHALDSAEPQAAAAVTAERFDTAMAALASLRAPIDAFFDTVTVNDPVPEKRGARLRLLARVRDAVHTVADFSRIEG